MFDKKFCNVSSFKNRRVGDTNFNGDRWTSFKRDRSLLQIGLFLNKYIIDYFFYRNKNNKILVEKYSIWRILDRAIKECYSNYSKKIFYFFYLYRKIYKNL